MSFYEVKPEILAWLPAIHRVRDDMGLSSVKYSDALVMAFLHRETHPIGRADSHRDGAPFYTAFQFANPYLKDALVYLDDEEMPTQARDYHGKVDPAIRVFLGHMEKYKGTHLYEPSMMAVIHKAGIGSAVKVRRLLDQGKVATPLEALEKHINIHNDAKYLSTWQRLLTVYAQWVHDENAKLHVCSTQYLGEFGEDWPEIPGVIE